MKNISTIMAFALVIIIAGIVAFINLYDARIETGVDIPQEDIESIVSEYISGNISELSPEPEVLGGTFYTTNIEFTSENSGVVEYEDGHIALIADFEYMLIDESNVEVVFTNVREAILE